MRLIAAGVLLIAAFTAEGLAEAQTEPAAPPSELVAPDARSLASDREVGEARRAYRAACNRHQNAGYCDCTTAGVAQVLMPEEVRIAARTIGERINAEGDTLSAPDSDTPPAGGSTAARIEHVEGFYANACARYRN
ncbi:MAG TPA: hypothetical protein VEA80_03035 [Vitreimonas sp.]|uniref:hypothetical protein n=1 Tax=Vitreimonas sp. TaxID=3069702 RepID=UPI002D6E13A8|nr:hypothetical protein [Vitreimonas sp.]HYD86428.1 hypothetical protein [Vitreimonas sp.]